MLRRRFMVMLAHGWKSAQRPARELTSSSDLGLSTAGADLGDVGETALHSSATFAPVSEFQKGTASHREVLSRVLERTAEAITTRTTTAQGTAPLAQEAVDTAVSECSVLGVSCPPRPPSSTAALASHDLGESPSEATWSLFAQSFCATLHVIEQHPHARILERAGNPAASVGEAPVAAAVLALGTGGQANALRRLVEAQQLVLACVSLCRQTWTSHAADQASPEAMAALAENTAEALLDATNKASRPTGVELRYRRRVLRQYLRRELRSELAAELVLAGRSDEVSSEISAVKAMKPLDALVRRALFTDACDTMANVLGRTALQLFLARELLEYVTATEAAGGDVSQSAAAPFLQHVAYALLAKLTTCVYRFDRFSAHDGVHSQTMRGLDEFVQALLFSLDDEHGKMHRFSSAEGNTLSLHEGASDRGGQRDGHRYRAIVRSQLRTFLGLYAALLPHTVRAAVLADRRHSVAGGDDEDTTKTAPRVSAHLVQVLHALRRGWQRGARVVRVEGPSSSAVWWLQAAAVTMDAFGACAERQMQYAGEAIASELSTATSQLGLATLAPHPDEVALLNTVQDALSVLLREFFHYDRAIYAHYQGLTAPKHDEKEGPTQGAEPGVAADSTLASSPLPQRRRSRGRRSLFQLETDETALRGADKSTGAGGGAGGAAGEAARSDSGSVLRQQGSAETAGETRRRVASRFVARNRVLLQEGVGVAGADLAALHAAATASARTTTAAAATGKRSRKKGGAAGADALPSVADTEEAFSSLFHIFVLLRATPSSLAARYGITSDRSSELEETWLNLVNAGQRLQQTVMSPRPEHEGFLAQQRKVRFRVAAADAFAQHRRDTASRPQRGKSSATTTITTTLSRAEYEGLVAVLEPPAIENHLPQSVQNVLERVRRRALVAALATGAVSDVAWEAHLQRARQATLRVLDSVVAALPWTTLDGVLLVSSRLTEALLLVLDRSADLAMSATQQRRTQGTVSRDWSRLQAHRRGLVSVLSTGAQALVLGNDALCDGVCGTWWCKRAPCVADLSAQPRALGFSRRLLCAAVALQARHRLLPIARRLQNIDDAVRCLEETTSRSHVVDVAARQALVTGALSQLLAVGYDLRAQLGDVSGDHKTGKPSGQGTTVPPADDPAQAQRQTQQLFQRLVDLVHADAELLLLSSFAAGLTAWREAAQLFFRDSAVPAEQLSADILPLTLSAIIASLQQSRLADNPSTHASVCEHALLTLSALCEHGLACGQPHDHSGGSAQPRWNAALAQVCTYCLGWALRDIGSSNSTAADLAAVYVALQTRFTLPLDVPWRDELGRRLSASSRLRGWLLAEAAVAPVPGNYLLFLDHSSRLLFSDCHRRPFHVTLQDASLDALREYHHALQHIVSFSALESLDDVAGATPHALKARLALQQQRVRVWFNACGQAEQLARPLVTFEVVDVTQSHALHSLVRFVERHAADQLFASTQLQTTATTATARGLSSPSTASTGGGCGGVAVALDVHATALLLLRFIGNLYQSHSWVIICQAFRVAQLAHRAEVVLGTREAVPLRVAGLSTVLGLLQEMPTPHAPVRLRPTFLTVLYRLSDMLTASNTTLLGIRNGSAVRGWLSRPHRDTYRGAIFGVKQMVLYVQREAVLFCAGAAAAAAAAAEAEQAESDLARLRVVARRATSTPDQPREHEDDDGNGQTTRAPYFTEAYQAGRPREALEKEFALFVAILLSALDLVLGCVRYHALQQRVIDSELTSIVTACFDVLCRLFCDAAHTLLREEAAHLADEPGASTNPGQRRRSKPSPFATEHAELLLVGLSLVAAMNVVQQHDPAGIFFTQSAQRQAEAVLAAVDALREHTPVLHDALQTALRGFLQCGFYTRDLSWRLGTILYGRADVTVMVVLLSTFADTAARQPAAARMYWKAWRQLQGELAQHTTETAAEKGKIAKASHAPARARVPSAFHVPSKQEFLLAASAFNELDVRYQQMHIDMESLEGGVGVFSASRGDVKTRAGHRTSAPSSSDTTDGTATASPEETSLRWTCAPEKLVTAVVEDASLRTQALAADVPIAAEDAAEDGEKEVMKAERLAGAAGHQETYPRAGFVFSAYIDVAEAAAEGELTPEEIIGAVIKQSLDLGLVSNALVPHGAATDGATVINGMTPQVRAVMESYLRNLVALFELYPLAQICAHRDGAASLFRLLEPWLALRETSELARTERTTAARLWTLLTHKFRHEAMDPHEARFSSLQSDLLRAVRRARMHTSGVDTERPSSRATTAQTATHTSPKDIFFEPGVFATAAHEATAGLYAPSDVEELTYHDDARPFLREAKSKRSRASTPDQAATVYTTAEALRTPTFPTVVPLEVTLVLLRALLRGDRRVPEVRELADCVATYAARQYVLLRTRLDDSALNTLSVLLAEPHVCVALFGHTATPGVEAEAADPAQARSLARLWVMLGLPARSVHSGRARGTLFSPDKQRDLKKRFDAAGIRIDEDAGGSLEQAVFNYMRCAALYLKVLSTIASVLLRYKLFGDLVDDSVRALFYHSNTNPSDAARGDDAGSSASFSSTRHPDSEESPAQRRLARQTDPAWVNGNVFESVMLHYLNVSVALVHHADAIYHVAADVTVAVASGVPPVGSGGSHSEAAMAYAEEVRHLVADAIQGTLSSLGFLAGRTELTHVRAAAHRLVSGCVCDGLALPNSLAAFCARHPEMTTAEATTHFTASQARLGVLAQQHPAVCVGSPTMLAVLTPTYFERSLTYTMPRAESTAVTTIAASFAFHLQQRHVALAPLLAAVAELLASTPVRNSGQKMLCEKLARALLERPEFRLALAPPTLASGSGSVESVRGGVETGSHYGSGSYEAGSGAAGAPTGGVTHGGGSAGGAGSHAGTAALPNEVLIPFLAAITRGDVQITKATLAKLLHTAMTMRVDVFGEPPVPPRQATLSLTKGGGMQRVGGVFELSNPLYNQNHAPRQETSSESASSSLLARQGDRSTVVRPSAEPLQAESTGLSDASLAATQQQSRDDLALLARFSPSLSSDSASATHRRALASLNLSLPAAMEVAMHLGASRFLTKPESSRARSLLRAADDARRERVGAYRALLHAATVSGHAKPGEEDSTRVRPVLDAALHLEDPFDYGVAILHIQFALRKVVHAAFRRLGPHQTPAAVAMMTEMLYAVDPGFRARREADPVAGAQPTGPAAQQGRPHSLPAPPLDPMLTGTIRILLSRARLSAQAVGYAANGAPQRYIVPTTGHPDASANATLFQPVIFPVTATQGLLPRVGESHASLVALEGDNRTPEMLQLHQKLEEEAGVSVALTTSVMAASAKMKMRQAVKSALRHMRISESRRLKHRQRHPRAQQPARRGATNPKEHATLHSAQKTRSSDGGAS